MKVSVNDEKVAKQYRDIASRCGLDDTPLIDLSNLSQRQSVRIFAKDESKNITGSVKVRAALFNLVKAINGDEQHFLDASSGNYAKALIYLASQLGYKSTLLIPESFFSELEEYMSENGLDSKLFHDGIRNSDEARERARQYSDKHPELTFLDQYNNDGSWLCHYHFTAEEILSELARLQLKPTHFISGIGSGGTLIGIGKKLKEGNDVKVIGLESKVPHSIRGIRCLETATTPGVYSRLSRVVDRVISIDPEDVARFRAEQQFNFGVSAYANIYASAQLSRELDSGIILTVVPDGGTE